MSLRGYVANNKSPSQRAHSFTLANNWTCPIIPNTRVVKIVNNSSTMRRWKFFTARKCSYGEHLESWACTMLQLLPWRNNRYFNSSRGYTWNPWTSHVLTRHLGWVKVKIFKAFFWTRHNEIAGDCTLFEIWMLDLDFNGSRRIDWLLG